MMEDGKRNGLRNFALLMRTFYDFTWSVLKLKICEPFHGSRAGIEIHG